jgi:formylglycine-generating enzyme required for sulfatase activity
MVSIPGGSFDGHEIAPFRLDRKEVSGAAYAACVKAHKCEPPKAGKFSGFGKPGRENHPVDHVSAIDADTYCAWQGRRLPSEWEWEWVARGREEARTYPWGEDPPSCRLAVMDENSSDGGGWGCLKDATWPVGSKLEGASRDGVLNMGGNVAEWTSSSQGDARVYRGAAWATSDREQFACSKRVWVTDPTKQQETIGFRCASSE